MTAPEPFRARLLGAVPHGFLGRAGGVSEGLYAGLNCGIGSDDDAAAVAANRDAALAAVAPGACLLTPYQVHSADCVTVDAPFAKRPRADAPCRCHAAMGAVVRTSRGAVMPRRCRGRRRGTA